MKRWHVAYATVCAFAGVWINRNAAAWYGLVFWAFIYALVGCAFLGLLLEQVTPPATATRKEPCPQRSRCYLVVHLDLKVSPPVALFVHTYSCSAKDLTHTGAREARADLYMVEADTFEEALGEMRRLQPLYFPWVTPLLTRNR